MKKLEKFISVVLTALSIVVFSINSRSSEVLSTTYYHNDALGSPIAATDENGDIKWIETYRPYGERMLNEPLAETNQIGYIGHAHDRETGLSYMQGRYYDPVVGRFMGVDTASVLEHIESNPMMFNRYAYANNNPYRYIDPDGNSPLEWGFVASDVASASFNIATGNYALASWDLTNVVFDLVGPPGLSEVSHLAKLGRTVDKVGDFAKATKGASKEITKSSRKRVKRLVKDLSDNSRQNNGLSQEKADQLRRIVEKAGGKIRNDGASGVKGSSAGKPHVQTEGLGKSIDSRHIWTKEGVQ